jgi:hypothetical protein
MDPPPSSHDTTPSSDSNDSSPVIVPTAPIQSTLPSSPSSPSLTPEYSGSTSSGLSTPPDFILDDSALSDLTLLDLLVSLESRLDLIGRAIKKHGGEWKERGKRAVKEGRERTKTFSVASGLSRWNLKEMNLGEMGEEIATDLEKELEKLRGRVRNRVKSEIVSMTASKSRFG